MFDVEARKRVQQILEYFSSLAGLGREMNSSDRIHQTLTSTVASMVETFGLDRALLMMSDRQEGRFVPVAAEGLEVDFQDHFNVPPDVVEMLLSGPQVRISRPLPGDLAERLRRWLGGWFAGETASLVSLTCAGELVGMFVFSRPKGQSPLQPHDRNLLGGMCQNVSVYLHNQIVLARLGEKERQVQALYEETKDLYREAVMAFLTAIDIKDGYTKEHSLRVARMSSALAQEVGFDEREVEGIYFAGLLHDIGKILVDKQILTKPGSLDLTEYAEMSQHSELGAEIVSQIRFPWKNLIPTIRHHHDHPYFGRPGAGRKRHLALGVGIIGLTDAFDAMTSDRPYRRALSLRESIAEITGCLGEQFHPEIARVFLTVLDRDLDRPPRQRSILTKQVRNGNRVQVRRAIADALAYIEQSLGVVTNF